MVVSITARCQRRDRVLTPPVARTDPRGRSGRPARVVAQPFVTRLRRIARAGRSSWALKMSSKGEHAPVRGCWVRGARARSRPRRSARPAVSLGAALAATMLVYGLTQGIASKAGPSPLPLVVLIAATLVSAGEAVGLPKPISRPTRLGVRNHEREYDRQLQRLIAPFVRSLVDPRVAASGRHRERAIRAGQGLAQRLAVPDIVPGVDGFGCASASCGPPLVDRHNGRIVPVAPEPRWARQRCTVSLAASAMISSA